MMTNELITAIEAMDPLTLGSAAIAATTIILGFALCALIRYLMIAIGYSKMYRKAGVAGWKAFIPVYHTYNNYKLSLRLVLAEVLSHLGYRTTHGLLELL